MFLKCDRCPRRTRSAASPHFAYDSRPLGLASKRVSDPSSTVVRRLTSPRGEIVSINALLNVGAGTLVALADHGHCKRSCAAWSGTSLVGDACRPPFEVEEDRWADRGLI